MPSAWTRNWTVRPLACFMAIILAASGDVRGETFATSFDSGNPRMVTGIALDDLQTGSPLAVLNTHWSLSSSAERESANLIRQRLPQLFGDVPTIIMGDLNTTESSTAFETLRDGDSLTVWICRKCGEHTTYRQTHAANTRLAVHEGWVARDSIKSRHGSLR